MGGRVRFGNDGFPAYWKGNLQQFFRHMSGFWGEGEHRSAGAAFAMANSVDPVVRLHGAAETTLVPTVRFHSPSGPGSGLRTNIGSASRLPLPANISSPCIQL